MKRIGDGEDSEAGDTKIPKVEGSSDSLVYDEEAVVNMCYQIALSILESKELTETTRGCIEFTFGVIKRQYQGKRLPVPPAVLRSIFKILDAAEDNGLRDPVSALMTKGGNN
jgi:hypothetical protein